MTATRRLVGRRPSTANTVELRVNKKAVTLIGAAMASARRRRLMVCVDSQTPLLGSDVPASLLNALSTLKGHAQVAYKSVETPWSFGGAPLSLLPNGKVLIAGGQGLSGDYLATAEIYDPATGTFSATGNMHTARAFLSATLLGNGEVLIAGGQGPAPNFQILGSAELYNPATGKFTLTGSLNTPRCFQTSLLLPSGKALVAGGVTARVTTASAELYAVSTGTFSVTGSRNDARENHAMVLLPTGAVLVAGGNSLSNTARVFYWNTAELFH